MDSRTNHRLTAVNQQWINLLIYSISWVEVMLICGNLRYTGHFWRPNLVLAENCKHLYLMVRVILSPGCSTIPLHFFFLDKKDDYSSFQIHT